MFLPPIWKPNTNNKGIVQYHTKVFVNNSWGNIQREHIAREGEDMNGFLHGIKSSESLPIIVCPKDDVLNFFEILINKNSTSITNSIEILHSQHGSKDLKGLGTNKYDLVVITILSYIGIHNNA